MRDIAHISIWKKKDDSAEKVSTLRSTPIDNLDLTNRPINCLKRAGCMTVGDVLDLIESERGLKSVRNLGVKSEAEIIDKVQAYKESFETSETARPSDSTGRTPVRGVLIRPRGKVWYTRLDEYDIPPETISMLNSCGIFYVADFYKPDFESEPGWKAVREVFASIMAKANA